jgi:hypothetical protein
MALFWASDYIEKALPDHLRARFDEAKADPHDKTGPDRAGWLPLYDGKSGEMVVKIPGGVATRISRVKMRKLFSDGLDIQVCNKPTGSDAEIELANICSLVKLCPVSRKRETLLSCSLRMAQLLLAVLRSALTEVSLASNYGTSARSNGSLVKGVGRTTLLGAEAAALSVAPCTIVNGEY